MGAWDVHMYVFIIIISIGTTKAFTITVEQVNV
jgi:hypothetical protein